MELELWAETSAAISAVRASSEALDFRLRRPHPCPPPAYREREKSAHAIALYVGEAQDTAA